MMAEDYEMSDVMEEDVQGSIQFESTSRLTPILPLEGQTMEDPLSLEYTLPSTSFVVSEVNLDLETFTENYQGYDKVERLLFIAAHCPSLEVESLRLAAEELRYHTLDIKRYEKVLGALHEAEERHHISPKSSVDHEYFQSSATKVRTLTKRLEEGYREAREGGIAESIRQALLELAEHSVTCGEFQKALEYYLRTRDFAGKPSHHFSMCFHVACMYWRLKKLDQARLYIGKSREG
jgi:COP9 signalosome complex subunit 1